MEPESQVDDIPSPESTVTSLLSRSGRLKTSMLVPECTTTIRYRNRDYDSASLALDAYIADFDRSCSSHTGRLVLPQSPPSSLRKLRLSTLRNKDVLRESLTERELDYLNLPVTSIYHRVNRDRLSVTTDELLSIPNDGSLPVTQTSALIQGLLSRSGGSQLHCATSCPGCRACSGLGSTHPCPNHRHHPHLLQAPRSSRCRGRSGALPSSHRASAPEWAVPSSSYPPWLSSTSDQKYPSWLDECEPRRWDDKGVPLPVGPRGAAPSWVAELEEEDPDLTGSQVDCRLSLRDLRVQFDDHISRLAAERKSSDIMGVPLRDGRIESLIQKADQVLNSLCHSRDGEVSPVNTDELLSSSSQQPSLRLDLAAAAAAGGGTEAETDGWKQPGPVEALKQMLFRLQAVEAKLQQQEGNSPAVPLRPEREKTEETSLKQRPESEAELEILTGGLSLQRALHHLNRLKLLVEEPRGKDRPEEKDEDEGRYSSSSADGFGVCTQDQRT